MLYQKHSANNTLTKQEALDLFNGKEVNRMNAFNLSGYQAEKVKDNDFELMKGKGNICKVNSSIIEEVEAGSNDRGSYEAYTRLKYELEVISEKYNKRKVWKSVNLSSTDATGKKPKTPVQKLADVFFTLGLEFNNQDQLVACNEKFVNLNLVVSFSSFKPKDRDEAMQLHTITGIAPADWESGVTAVAEKVAF